MEELSDLIKSNIRNDIRDRGFEYIANAWEDRYEEEGNALYYQFVLYIIELEESGFEGKVVE